MQVNAASATIASPITSGSLTKSGAGQLTLAGSNSYHGRTDVLAGTLTVNGSLATSGAVLVQSGALLTGGGTVGTVNVASSIPWPPAATAPATSAPRRCKSLAAARSTTPWGREFPAPMAS